MNFYWVSFILQLVFFLICSVKNSGFIYKYSALTQTWKIPLSPTPNFAFNFTHELSNS